MMYTQEELDNHANQLNPNNDAYWASRGYDNRPSDWGDDDDYDNNEEYDWYEDPYYYDCCNEFIFDDWD